MSNENRSERAARKPSSRSHTDALLDEALIETFPASDPVAITMDEPNAPPRRRRRQAQKNDSVDTTS